MVEELRRALALLFRRKGRDTLTEREFVLGASMDLRWFPPRDAQKLLEAALRSGLLVQEGGSLKPTFELAAEEIPLDFRPSTEVLRAAPRPEDLFLIILGRVEAKTKIPRKTLVARANELQQRLGIHLEVAALLVAREKGVEVSDFMAPVEELVVARASAPSPRGG